MFTSSLHRNVLVTPCLFMLLASWRLAFADPIGEDFKVNTTTYAVEGRARVATGASGAFAVTWYSFRPDSTSYNVYARHFGADGSPTGPEFKVNTYDTSTQTTPAIAMDDAGNSVIVWVSNGQDGSLGGIYAQRYDSTGQPAGGEFRVNTYTAGEQALPAVSMNASGAFIVAWSGVGEGGKNDDVYAQRYDAEGQPAGGQFRANTYLGLSQWFPAVAMNDSGRFVIAWESDGQDGSLFGIYAQVYDEYAVPVGGELRANNYTANSQARPDVAIDEAGDFVIVWQSVYQDGDWYGAYGRMFDALGTPKADEFLVNTTTDSGQQYPTVAMNATGDFVVAWFKESGGNVNEGLFGRHYSRAGSALDEEFTILSTLSWHQKYPDVAMETSGSFIIAWTAPSLQGGQSTFAQRFSAEEIPCLPLRWWTLFLAPAAAAILTLRRKWRIAYS